MGKDDKGKDMAPVDAESEQSEPSEKAKIPNKSRRIVKQPKPKKPPPRPIQTKRNPGGAPRKP